MTALRPRLFRLAVRTSLAAVLLCAATGVALVHAETNRVSIPPEELRGALDELTPAYRIYTPPSAYAHDGRLPPAELLGFDLAQDGNAIEGPVPTVQAGTALEFTLYWRMISARMANSRLRILIRGPGLEPAPGFIEFYDIDIRGWEAGGVYKQHCTLALHRRSHVGDGSLYIDLWETDKYDDRSPLYAGPIRVPAAFWPSQWSSERLSGLFGSRCVQLGASTRLGPGTQATVEVPGVLRDSPTQLGVISYLTRDTTFTQGERVCRIDLVDADAAQTETVYLESGVSTALYLHDQYAPGEIETRKIEAAYSDEAADSTPEEPRLRHHYVGRIPLTATVRPTRLVFTYLRDSGFLDINELALVLGNPPDPAEKPESEAP